MIDNSQANVLVPKLAKPAADNGLVLFVSAQWDVPRLACFLWIHRNQSMDAEQKIAQSENASNSDFCFGIEAHRRTARAAFTRTSLGLQVRLNEVCVAEGSWTLMSLVKRRPCKLAGGAVKMNEKSAGRLSTASCRAVGYVGSWELVAHRHGRCPRVKSLHEVAKDG